MAETAQQTRRTRSGASSSSAPAAFARALQESLDRRDQGQSR